MRYKQLHIDALKRGNWKALVMWDCGIEKRINKFVSRIKSSLA